jgi:adenylyltransferase/sulfurtransferase
MPIAFDDRYSRQILFREIGAEGQKKLSQARVGIVGCGATGSVIAGLLARSGVGQLRIIDRDFVEPSNLQRQSLFDEDDARESLPKAIAAARQIARFNSQMSVEPLIADLKAENITDLLSGVQLILDGTDNFETRYLINDYAIKNSVPWIYSAAVGSYAATLNIVPRQTTCLVCLFPDQPGGVIETCDTSGILNSAVNLVGSIAATEAMKLLVDRRASLRRSLLAWDLWTNHQAEVNADRPRAGCRCCEKRNFVYLQEQGRSQTTLCGRNAVQIHERHQPVDFPEIAARLLPHGIVRHNQYVLKFCRDPYEMTLFSDGRAIITGTSDAALARSFYARYIGS